MNSKSALDNIKSDFFIPRIFVFMQKLITFKIVNYNKVLQKKLKISIKDFIEIYEIYAPTKIEIIPIKNAYGKFINIKEKEKRYYHIYFNDNKEEIKNKYLINEEDKVDKIKIKIDNKVKSLNGLFDECNCIESINFKKYCRKKGYLERIFSKCSTLKELTLSNFYNNEMDNMHSTFCEFPSLQKLNLYNFFNNKADNMHSSFKGCKSLKEINIINFNNNVAHNMHSTFLGCKALKILNINNFNSNKARNMHSTFEECSSFQNLNISNFNNNEASNMHSTFLGCPKELKVKYN